jgi:replicative DNA helicase
MSGGLSGGDLLVFVGRPGAGKTYLMLYTALEAWKCGQVPMFVSMEMKPLLIAQRLAAMATRKSITQLRHADMSNWAVADMHEQLQLLAQRKQPFWLIDGALSATVDDLLLMVRQLQPSVLYVDGAYLIRTAGWRNSKWERLAEIIERLKSEVAEQMNIPVLVSYQFNRGATKKSTEILGVEDIGGTDVIGQLASVVLGLLQEQGVETLRQRRVQILKGRSGESGLFNICWNFDTGPDYMNFREITTAQAGEDLDYIV